MMKNTLVLWISQLLLATSPAWAALPPTTSKARGDASRKTTFNFEFPRATPVRTGTTTALHSSDDKPNFVGQSSAWSPTNPDDRDLESSVGNWLAFDDAAAIPDDLSGGTPTVTCTRSTSDPLDGSASLLMTLTAADLQGEGCAVPFNVQPAYQGRNVEVKFPVSIVSGTYVNGDFEIWAYNVTKTSMIKAYCKAFGPPEVICTFPTTARDATPVNHAYRLGIFRAVTTAAAVVLKADNFSISPTTTPIGMAGSDWESCTVTGSWIANTTYTCLRRLVGDTREYQVKLALSGAPTSATLTINLPSGDTIDTTKLINASIDRQILGTVSMFDTGTGNPVGFVVYSTSTAVQIEPWTIDTLTTGSVRQSGAATQSSPFTWANGDTLTASFSVPLVGRSANVSMGESSVQYAYNSNTADSDDTSSFAYGPEGVAIGSYTTATRSKRVRFTSPVSSTDHVVLQVQVNGIWMNTDYLLRFTQQGSNAYGMWAAPVTGTTTDFDVNFGNGGARPNNATYAGAGDAWSNHTGVKWRLAKSRNPQFVGAGSLRSGVHCYGGNGFGGSSSGETMIRNFTNCSTTGSAVTRTARAATTADYFTINEDGIYNLSYTDLAGTSTYFGFSRNSSQTSTAIDSVTATDVLKVGGNAAGVYGNVGRSLYLPAGVVIRAHTVGVGANTNYVSFSIEKVAH